MAGTTTNISIRMDTALKAQAEALFSELGMNLTTAINVFVRAAIRYGGIPFYVRLNPRPDEPNSEIVSGLLDDDN